MDELKLKQIERKIQKWTFKPLSSVFFYPAHQFPVPAQLYKPIMDKYILQNFESENIMQSSLKMLNEPCVELYRTENLIWSNKIIVK